MVDKAREIALKTLYKIDNEQSYANLALDEILKQNKKSLSSKDIGLISEIVYGTITWKLTIDEIIKKYSKIKLKKISIWILNILRIGIYQIIFLDKIPKSAAVNESVNLAKRYGHQSSSNFVNAILRKVDKKDYEELFSIPDDIERISKTQSMPIWIIQELLKDKTIQEVEQICKNSNLKPKISIRVNTLKISNREIQNKLKEKNINFEQGILEDFIILDKVKDIENMEMFKCGLFTVQDEAAGLAAIVLNPNDGENVLDACSSPGGKTTYLAQIMNNKGKIEAWDIYEHRTKLVEQNAKRLGIDIIDTNIKDATIFDEKYLEKFDKILLDVPCLGIGVLKRKPDIKWRKNKEDVEKIAFIQEQILNTCSKYIKVGGSLLYSTCSILKSENQEVIESFLKEHPNFEIDKIKTDNIEYFSKYMQKIGYIEVLPNEITDGFFICKITKKHILQ